jgi:two-component system NarL family sensor kinase
MSGESNLTYLILIACLVAFLFATIIVLFILAYQRNMSEKENQIQKIKQINQLNEFKAVVEAQENEKEKIANNLHDEIGPLLTVLKLNLTRHHSNIKKQKIEPEQLKPDMQLIDQIIHGLRETCHELTPKFLLNHGLIKTLENHLDLINNTENLKTSLSGGFQEIELLPKQDLLNIYRISLEILNNILKHAHSNNLHVDISQQNNSLQITFKHDGSGMNNLEFKEYSLKDKSLGLKTLKSRISLLKGEIDFQQHKDNSLVSVTIPILN